MLRLILTLRDAWLLAVPALLFLFYLIAWISIGPEPKPGPVVARYEPPAGISPAAVRYIVKGTTDGRSFASVIAQLAVRGCLRVERSGKLCKLSRLMSDRAAESSLAPEEKRLLALLFEDAPEIELSGALDQRSTAQNGRYLFHIHEELDKQFRGKIFTRHAGLIAFGLLATFASALPLAATATGRESSGAVFMTFWILFVGPVIGMMTLSFASFWKSVVQSGLGFAKLLPGTAAIAVFVTVIAFFLRDLAKGVSLSFALMIVALLLINVGWSPFLKRKSPLGRQLADQIAGFRHFLEPVEQDQMNRLTPAYKPPTKTPPANVSASVRSHTVTSVANITPAVTPSATSPPEDNTSSSYASSKDLNRFLPYAIALDVKESWGDQLSETFLATTVFVE